MRVVIVNDASTARGGATGLALMQARLMRGRGLDVTYFAADTEPNAELAALGVTLINAGAEPLMKSTAMVAATRGLYNRDVRRLMSALIAQQDSAETVYHVHSWSKALSVSLFSALAPVAPRVFIHGHDFFLACPNGGFMDYRAMEPCTRTPLSRACLTTNCDKRSLAQKGWRVARSALLTRTLPKAAPWGGVMMIHPLMRRYFERAGYPAGLLSALRNPATALTGQRVRAESNTGLLFIGRIEAEKGIEDLIAAAEAAAMPLTVIGEGPLQAPLAAAHPKVRFTGWRERAAIAAEANQARALVMPSRYPEPFGLVAAEAALSGLPAVVSRPALLSAEIEAGGLGWACDTRDAAEFAALLGEIAAMPAADMEAMSRRARAGGTALCTTPEAWIDAILAAYAAATAAGGISSNGDSTKGISSKGISTGVT